MDQFNIGISIATNEGSIVDEGNTTLTFTVSLNKPTDREISVQWSTIIEEDDNTTVNDFESVTNQNLVFMVDEQTKTIEVTIKEDEELEEDETFTVTLSGASEGILITTASAKGTIRFNDLEPDKFLVSISAGSGPFMEGDLIDFTFTANIESDSPPELDLDLSISVTEIGSSYLAWRAPRNFNLTETQNTLILETHDDERVEIDGMITVTLNLSRSYLVDDEKNSKTVIVKSEDSVDVPEQPRISVAQVAVAEIIRYNERSLQGRGQSAQGESEQVPIRPTVSINALELTINEGDAANFIVQSRNGDGAREISVYLQISHENTLIEGSEIRYVSLSGQDSESISVPTINDDHAGKDGLISVSIQASPSFEISTGKDTAVVTVSDAIDRQQRVADITAQAQSFLPDLMGIMGSNAVDIVTQRSSQSFNGDNELSLELGGENSISGLVTMGGEMINENTTTLKSFLGDSSFAFSLLSGDDFTIPATVWGLGDYQNITSEVGNYSSNWSGDIFTGRFGIDTMIRDGLMAGLSASISESEIVFDQVDADDVKFISQTTTLNPYFGWTSSDQNSELHAIAGYGRGEIDIAQETYEDETLASESYTFGLTGSQLLYSSDSILSGTSNLSIKGETWLARQKNHWQRWHT